MVLVEVDLGQEEESLVLGQEGKPQSLCGEDSGWKLRWLEPYVSWYFRQVACEICLVGVLCWEMVRFVPCHV